MSVYVFVYSVLHRDLLLRVGERQAKAMTRSGAQWRRATFPALRRTYDVLLSERPDLQNVTELHQEVMRDGERIRPEEPVVYRHLWEFLSPCGGGNSGSFRSVANNYDVLVATAVRLGAWSMESVLDGQPRPRPLQLYRLTLLVTGTGFIERLVLAENEAEAQNFGSRLAVTLQAPTVADIDAWYLDPDVPPPSASFGVWACEHVPYPDTLQLSQAQRSWHL